MKGSTGCCWRAWVLAVVVVWLTVPNAARAETSAAFDDRTVQEVVAMAEAGLSEELIFERIRRIAEFPELTGQDLAELKQRGVPEGILIHMVRMGPRSGAAVPPRAVEGADRPQLNAPPPQATAAAQGDSRVRVVIDRSFPITYYEVMVDGQVVTSGGKLWQGSAAPGEVLERPRMLAGEDRFTVLDAEVEPGTHAVKVGFAVASVAGGGREEYVTAGVRAVGSGLGSGRGGNPNLGAMCTVAPGQTCAVTAAFEQVGARDYGIAYAVSILE